MSVIHVLDEKVANLIAAGEVVERPFSVVKELVENSIDAKATSITIEIRQGGISYIKVSDNGVGMTPEDAKKAFLKHATSKILDKEDLYSIKTLGFRGEALCAIAAVSDIILTTKQKDEISGYQVKISAGKVWEENEIAFDTGTSIVVENLFVNTPARFKFLKSENAETAVISTLVENLALSHPEIKFKLFTNDKEKLSTYGNGNLGDTIFSVFGKSFFTSMQPVNLTLPYKDKSMRVHGFVSTPLFSRPNRTKQLFYINNRLVKSRVLQNALENAYKSYILVGRFPICVLFLDMDCSDIDVNVHPSKLEVKFSDEKAVYDIVLSAVSSALRSDLTKNEFVIKDKTDINTVNKKEDKKTNVPLPSELAARNIDNSVQWDRELPIDKSDSMPAEPINTTVQKYYDWTIISENGSIKKDELMFEQENPLGIDKNSFFKSSSGPVSSKKMPQITCDLDDTFPVDFFRDVAKPGQTEITISNIKADLPKQDSLDKNMTEDKENQEPVLVDTKNSYKLIGECFHSYVILEKGEDVIFIDKHALHERMNFEKLKNSAYISSQTLLSPLVCNVDGDKYAILLERKDMLSKLGFEIDDFGSGTILIREIPDLLSNGQAETFIEGFAETLTVNKKFIEAELMDEFLYDIACKASIRAGWNTNEKELTALIDMYFENEHNLKYCPHGRPIQFIMSKKTIEKQFKRIL